MEGCENQTDPVTSICNTNIEHRSVELATGSRLGRAVDRISIVKIDPGILSTQPVACPATVIRRIYDYGSCWSRHTAKKPESQKLGEAKCASAEPLGAEPPRGPRASGAQEGATSSANCRHSHPIVPQTGLRENSRRGYCQSSRNQPADFLPLFP